MSWIRVDQLTSIRKYVDQKLKDEGINGQNFKRGAYLDFFE